MKKILLAGMLLLSALSIGGKAFACPPPNQCRSSSPCGCGDPPPSPSPCPTYSTFSTQNKMVLCPEPDPVITPIDPY